MEKIFNSINVSSYNSISMKGKYVYMKRINNDSVDHYIFRIDDIIENDNDNITYKSNRSYRLNIPNSDSKYSILYDHLNVIELLKTDSLYEMTLDEFLTSFRLFIQSDHQSPKAILL